MTERFEIMTRTFYIIAGIAAIMSRVTGILK